MRSDKAERLISLICQHFEEAKLKEELRKVVKPFIRSIKLDSTVSYCTSSNGVAIDWTIESSGEYHPIGMVMSLSPLGEEGKNQNTSDDVKQAAKKELTAIFGRTDELFGAASCALLDDYASWLRGYGGISKYTTPRFDTKEERVPLLTRLCDYHYHLYRCEYVFVALYFDAELLK